MLLLILNTWLWLIPSSSILHYGYADLTALFDTLPFILMFLIPSATMNLFVDDFENGTSDFLFSKPISISKIWIGHFLFVFVLVLVFLSLTLTSCMTIFNIKSDSGIIDVGQIVASYLGVILAAIAFITLSLFCSSFAKSQASAFLLSIVFCYFLYKIPGQLAELSLFRGQLDYFIQYLSLDTHFYTLGKGLFELRSILYISSLFAFLSFLGIRNISLRLR